MRTRPLARSYAWCERLARRAAGNFYHAFRLLPAAQRRSMCALYAFSRVADDLSDGPWPVEARRAGHIEPEAPALSTWLQEKLHWVPGWGEKPDTAFEPLHLGGLDPLVWGLAASLLLTIGISLATRPDPSLLAKYFP